VPKPAIRPDVHETFDVHGHLGSKGTLHLVVPLDLFPEKVDLLVGQIPGPSVRIDPARINNLAGSRLPDPIDIGEGNLDPLPSGQINTCDTCHQIVSAVLDTILAFLGQEPAGSTLALLVARIPLAYDPDHSPATNHLAVLADRLNASSYLHGAHPGPLIIEL
jgi:hypothetical protein